MKHPKAKSFDDLQMIDMGADVKSIDVFHTIALIEKLVNLKPGDMIKHEWGWIRREPVVTNPFGLEVPKHRHEDQWVECMGIKLQLPGFLFSFPDDEEQDKIDGRWGGHNALALVAKLYNYQLTKRLQQNA